LTLYSHDLQRQAGFTKINMSPITCPDGSKPRYRWVVKAGKKIRLAFCGKKKVIEVKKKGGKAHKVTSKKTKKR